MKILIFLCLLFTLIFAKNVPVAYETIMGRNGRYHYHYELTDGSKASQDGILKHISLNHDGEAVDGKFSFVAKDGVEYALSYTADENGYRPSGQHLPTPPPIPDSVFKSLRYIAEHPPAKSENGAEGKSGQVGKGGGGKGGEGGKGGDGGKGGGGKGGEGGKGGGGKGGDGGKAGGSGGNKDERNVNEENKKNEKDGAAEKSGQGGKGGKGGGGKGGDGGKGAGGGGGGKHGKDGKDGS